MRPSNLTVFSRYQNDVMLLLLLLGLVPLQPLSRTHMYVTIATRIEHRNTSCGERVEF